MGVYVCVGGWSVCGSSILSHSHPLLSFYGFVHYLFVHSLWLYNYVHSVQWSAHSVLLVHTCVVLGDTTLHMYVVMVTCYMCT